MHTRLERPRAACPAFQKSIDCSHQTRREDLFFAISAEPKFFCNIIREQMKFHLLTVLRKALECTEN